MKRKLLAGMLALSMAMSLEAGSATPSFPAKPVKLILGFPPGGSLDVPMRILATRLGNIAGQQFVVENRAGASGLVAAQAVAGAAPDGYNLYLSSSALSSWPALIQNLPFDPLRDLAPVAQIAVVPTVIGVGPGVPAKNIREFIALTRSKPGTMTYASAGNGSASHFVGELFKSLTGASLMHVPYKGAAPAMTDLLGGRLDAVFLGLSGVQQQTSVRILAVTNPERAPQIPNVPTVAEEVPEYRPKNFYAAWVGLHGPRATPPAVVGELNSLLEKGLTHADTRRQMIEVGSVPQYLGAAEFTKKIASEATGFAEMVKQFNIRAD